MLRYEVWRIGVRAHSASVRSRRQRPSSSRKEGGVCALLEADLGTFRLRERMVKVSRRGRGRAPASTGGFGEFRPTQLGNQAERERPSVALHALSVFVRFLNRHEKVRRSAIRENSTEKPVSFWAMPPGEGLASLPDLLHARPRGRLSEELDAALVFAFAGSTSSGLFMDSLERAAVAPSTWEGSAFIDDLFVRDFVRSCFRVRIGNATPVLAINHLVRVLTAPPLDLDTIHFRRAIVGELIGHPPLRASVERLYLALGRFRSVLEGATSADRADPNRRQLDVLRRFREVVVLMEQDFGEASSGLSRLAEFSLRVRRSEAFRALEDLLRYDDRLATVSFKMSVGADRRVRNLELVSVQENEENQFVVSPPRRWLAKLELFARGYRFGNGEIMARLLDAVFEGVRGDWPALVQLVGDLEFYLGALSFADHARDAGLSMCMPELVGHEEPRVLAELWNPLLLGSGVTPIPCSITTDRHDATLLVTGPNSGGKTRLLQSLGLTQLLAQSGLPVPARTARVALASGLVVSLIQETHADQAEGRLGMELMRIRSLFERLPPGAIVILDELCSGTNPSEGEEIFELVIRMLGKLRPQAFITTHFLEFAARLAREGKIDGLRFLQVELGPSQEPTYQFTEGVARTSLAGQTAARLGVTGDQLLALVEARVANARARAAE